MLNTDFNSYMTNFISNKSNHLSHHDPNKNREALKANIKEEVVLYSSKKSAKNNEIKRNLKQKINNLEKISL